MACAMCSIVSDMNLPRRSRLIAAAITLFSILFMQLAVASYACPALDLGENQAVQAVSNMPVGDMDSCDESDPEQPSLCYAHGQAGNQSLDKPGAPSLQPFLAIGFWLPLAAIDVAPHPASTAHQSTFFRHATAPPLAIRNCCFRI